MPSRYLMVLFAVLLPLLSGCRLLSGEFRPTPTNTPIPLSQTATTAPAIDDNTNAIAVTVSTEASMVADSNIAPQVASTTTNAAAVVSCVLRTDWPTYRVVRGDTLAEIAQRGGTTVAALVQANCLNNADLIEVGQLLYVPFVIAAPLPPQQPVYISPTLTPAPQSVLVCYFQASFRTPGYGSPGFLNVVGHTQANRSYPVTQRTQGAYLIILDDGRSAWINPEFGPLNGHCDNVQWLVPANFLNQAQCWWIPNGTPTSTVDIARQQVGETLSAGRPYLVNGRTATLYRVVVSFSVWVHAADGVLIGNCGHFQDISPQNSWAAPRSTYNDPALPIAFDYPSNWTLTMQNSGPTVGGFVGTAPQIGTYPTVMGLPNDVVEVFFTRWPNISDAEQSAREQLRSFLESGRYRQVEPVQLYNFANGFTGWFFSATGPYGPTEVYTLSLNGQVFSITLRGDLALARIVRDSLRGTGAPLPPEPILAPNT